MTRNLSQTASDQVEMEVIPFAILLELGFDSAPAYLWSGVGELSWNSKTWIGMGEMGSISGVAEATDLADTVIKATLNHIDNSTMPDLVSEVTEMDPVGRPFVLYLAFFNDDNTVKEVLTLTAGLIDAIDLADGEGGALSMDLVSEAGLMGRRLFYRLDDQHQQKLFPGDKGFQFITGLGDEMTMGPSPVNNRGGKIFSPIIR